MAFASRAQNAKEARFAPSRVVCAAPVNGALAETSMPITHIDIVTIQPLVALLFGILILIMPRLLNYLIAIYLILIGVMGLWPQLFAHIH
jgi:Protein of unknown function (DUF3096)